MERILSKGKIIDLIKADKQFLKENVGVINIGLFGSYAKNKQTADSDIDLLVEFAEPRFDWIASLHDYMENKFNKKIDKKDHSFLQNYTKNNWRNIMQLRDIVSHHYEKVDNEVIFDICENHLTELQLTIQKIIT